MKNTTQQFDNAESKASTLGAKSDFTVLSGLWVDAQDDAEDAIIQEKREIRGDHDFTDEFKALVVTGFKMNADANGFEMAKIEGFLND